MVGLVGGGVGCVREGGVGFVKVVTYRGRGL